MAMSCRQKTYFFAGLNIALYGLALVIIGTWAHWYWIHGASSVAAWVGVVYIMCGVWDVGIAIDYEVDEIKRQTGGLSVGGLLVNLIVVIGGLIIIGFSTWGALGDLEQGIIAGAWSNGGTEQSIEVYVTVVMLGFFGHLLALITLLVDCCGEGLCAPQVEVVEVEDYAAAAYPYAAPRSPRAYPRYPRY